jgi:hypothetical protein
MRLARLLGFTHTNLIKQAFNEHAYLERSLLNELAQGEFIQQALKRIQN